jgi:hypothetical protein
LLRRHLVSVVCFAIAGLLGVAAIADHRNKGARMDRAEVLEWYCSHVGTHCGGPSSARIEAHWNQRQMGYEAAVTIVGGFAILLFAYRAVRR